MPELEGHAQDEMHGVLPAGTSLGKYELISILGQGAFGVTYRARDVTLNQEVAIKEYLPAVIAVRKDRMIASQGSGRTREGRGRGEDQGRGEGRSGQGGRRARQAQGRGRGGRARPAPRTAGASASPGRADLARFRHAWQ